MLSSYKSEIQRNGDDDEGWIRQLSTVLINTNELIYYLCVCYAFMMMNEAIYMVHHTHSLYPWILNLPLNRCD